MYLTWIQISWSFLLGGAQSEVEACRRVPVDPGSRFHWYPWLLGGGKHGISDAPLAFEYAPQMGHARNVVYTAFFDI